MTLLFTLWPFKTLRPVQIESHIDDLDKVNAVYWCLVQFESECMFMNGEKPERVYVSWQWVKPSLDSDLEDFIKAEKITFLKENYLIVYHRDCHSFRTLKVMKRVFNQSIHILVEYNAAHNKMESTKSTLLLYQSSFIPWKFCCSALHVFWLSGSRCEWQESHWQAVRNQFGTIRASER